MLCHVSRRWLKNPTPQLRDEVLANLVDGSHDFNSERKKQMCPRYYYYYYYYIILFVHNHDATNRK